MSEKTNMSTDKECLHLNFKNEPGFVCADCGTELITMEEKLHKLEARALKAEAEVERLRKKTEATMGVGNGGGQLFVHGDYESIKACQKIIFDKESLHSKLETAKEALRMITPIGSNYQVECDSCVDVCDHMICLDTNAMVIRKAKHTLIKLGGEK